MKSETTIIGGGEQESHQLKNNIFSLLILQGANYVLPLLTLPYLVRVLGPDKYGLVAFATALIGYFVVIVDYGFNLSATRQVTIARSNDHELNRIINAVIFTKFVLMLCGLISLSMIVLALSRLRTDWFLYLIAYLAVVGNVLFPVWYFQGIEKMKYITMLSIAAKVVVVIVIFAAVHRESDYLFAAAIQSSSTIVAGVASLAVLRRTTSITVSRPSLQDIRFQLREGWHLFVSTAAISLYTHSSVFVLGLVTNSTTVGYYGAAEKVMRAGQGMLGPVTQAVYPRICALVGESQEKAFAFIRKLMWVLGGAALLLSLAILATADQLVMHVLGPSYMEAAPILRNLAFVPFVVALSNIFGVQVMLNFGLKKQFGNIITFSGLVGLALIVSLAYFHGAEGVAIAVLVTEIMVTIAMGMELSRRGILSRIWGWA